MTQPDPTPNDRPAVWDLVLSDMRARDDLGLERYKVRLQPHNGRNFLTDLSEELVDAVAYLRGFREELKCLGQDLVRVRALLVEAQPPSGVALAAAVSLLESVLRRNPALGVDAALLPGPEPSESANSAGPGAPSAAGQRP